MRRTGGVRGGVERAGGGDISFAERAMKIKRIEHVGVIVRDTEASRKLWEGCFGIPLGAVEANDVRKLALYPVGESMVELIAGVKPDGKHQRMIAEGKGGLNHICFEVEDIDAALAELKAKGIALLDEKPRIGHEGCRIAFLDPQGTDNCLIELAERPAGEARHA
jgi:methylmalonyl-CoA/ethylmalonyl-CoA epimerase